MATPIKKITEAEMDAKGVCASPDVLEGTVAENKAVFDRMVRQIVAPAYNACAEVVDEINARQEQIATEESARVEAEKERAGVETDRVIAENARAEAESARAEAETDRVNAEAARVTAESKRAAAEEARAAAETNRTAAETSRALAERARETAESERDNAEKIRQQNETARQSNETDRVNAETARNVWENYDAQKSYVPGNKVAYKGSSYRNIQACTGVLPSNTAYWLMIAQRGVDGEGAGDMLEEIYDPQGKKQDIFDYVDTHKNDESIHVTAEEKAEWSGKAAGTHASQHASTGADPITPKDIGAKAADDSDVFIATYGTTTSAEIEAAYQAGKVVYCEVRDYHMFAPLTYRTSAEEVIFITIDTSGAMYNFVCNSDYWREIISGLVPTKHASTHASGGSDALYGLYTADTDPTTNNFINWTYE